MSEPLYRVICTSRRAGFYGHKWESDPIDKETAQKLAEKLGELQDDYVVRIEKHGSPKFCQPTEVDLAGIKLWRLT
jgi:hypothetical protein